MKENKMQLLCTILISISIILGGLCVGFSIRYKYKDTVVNETPSSVINKGLMTEQETANYLNLSQDKFNDLIAYQESEREKVTVYDTYSFIPFLKIENTSINSKLINGLNTTQPM
jgi:hypothetical protein